MINLTNIIMAKKKKKEEIISKPLVEKVEVQKEEKKPDGARTVTGVRG
jgi:hypothetical protein